MKERVKEYLNEYGEFVTKVTSKPSLNSESLCHRIKEIDAANISCPRVVTAALGLSSETGEFTEIVKKILLQGKPVSEENIFHMKRELGDIIWYWSTACMALNLDPFEVIEENRVKLETRYGERFEVKRSEHRKDGDL